MKSKVRIARIKLTYPKIKISWNSYVGKRCLLNCNLDSTITLEKVYLSDDIRIKAAYGGNLTIKKAFIDRGCTIVCLKSIFIDEAAQIGENVIIRDQDHILKHSKGILPYEYETGKIEIGKNTIIGVNSVVLRGVTLSDYSVLGANSFAKDIYIDANKIYAGNPLKFVKELTL